MEIINKKNDHLSHYKVSEYGCVCSFCGTTFSFFEHELNLIYKDSNIHPFQRYVRCPHCGKQMFKDAFVKFESDKDKENFIAKNRE